MHSRCFLRSLHGQQGLWWHQTAWLHLAAGAALPDGVFCVTGFTWAAQRSFCLWIYGDVNPCWGLDWRGSGLLTATFGLAALQSKPGLAWISMCCPRRCGAFASISPRMKAIMKFPDARLSLELLSSGPCNELFSGLTHMLYRSKMFSWCYHCNVPIISLKEPSKKQSA